jgi:hypothetical protein
LVVEVVRLEYSVAEVAPAIVEDVEDTVVGEIVVTNISDKVAVTRGAAVVLDNAKVEVYEAVVLAMSVVGVEVALLVVDETVDRQPLYAFIQDCCAGRSFGFSAMHGFSAGSHGYDMLKIQRSNGYLRRYRRRRSLGTIAARAPIVGQSFVYDGNDYR